MLALGESRYGYSRIKISFAEKLTKVNPYLYYFIFNFLSLMVNLPILSDPKLDQSNSQQDLSRSFFQFHFLTTMLVQGQDSFLAE
jgi:hypothetical protein